MPPEVQGTPVLGILAMYAGDPDEGEEVLRPLKQDIGPPAVDLIDRIPYTAFQAIVDPFSPKGWLNYHRGEHLAALSDDAIDAYVEHGARVESPMSQTVALPPRRRDQPRARGRHGGRPPRRALHVAPDRRVERPGRTEREIAWVRESSAAMAPFATGGVYLNFEQDEGAAHVRAGFSAEKYTRLVALKDKYDPENLFRINQNIAPSGLAHRNAGSAARPRATGVDGLVDVNAGRPVDRVRLTGVPFLKLRKGGLVRPERVP